ncbi:inner membrane complex protein [Gregarina niphandrodes]|uniref:Inner membrane complex protein n=1 Tax=Gregarina niphandrodes TaxID=110365 RepID=A0A023B749_GRENI|nr:inner membrane complex protein [Gregarina niphandrodes]EZG66948.1 inner membrane complex protein [Gregarina niphandrodes]|eukprot:XP_011130407.1 inner membrane complex protein [Gregarina niphandrodes]
MQSSNFQQSSMLTATPAVSSTSYQQQNNGAVYQGSSVAYQQGSSSVYQQGSSAAYQQGSSAAYQQGSSAAYQQGGNSTSRTITGQERVQSTRKVSSTIVNEQMMGPPPQDLPVREIEVPGPVQEVVTHVPRKEVIETERRVPKYEYEYVDKIVEVPRIEYVDKVVEVPQYHEVIVERKVPQVVDVPREVIKEVKIPRINYVEKQVEVPGEVIEVPKHFTVEQKVEFTRYNDRKKPVVVAQAVKPLIVEGAGFTEVDVYEYEPECVPVDVHVVKGVQAQVQAGGVVETTHRVVTIPSAQYNTILQQLNTHLNQTEVQKLPYLQERGQVTFLGERIHYTEPAPGVVIQGFDMSNLTNTYVDQASRKVHPVPPPPVAGTGAAAGAAGYTGGYNAGNYTTGGASYTAGSYPAVGASRPAVTSSALGSSGYRTAQQYSSSPNYASQQFTQHSTTTYSQPQTYTSTSYQQQPVTYAQQPITNYA